MLYLFLVSIQVVIFLLIIRFAGMIFHVLQFIVMSPVLIPMAIYDLIKDRDREVFDPDTIEDDPEAFYRCFGVYPDELEDWEYV